LILKIVLAKIDIMLACRGYGFPLVIDIAVDIDGETFA